MKTYRLWTVLALFAITLPALLAGGGQAVAQGATVDEPHCIFLGQEASSSHRVETPSGKVILVCHQHPVDAGPASDGRAVLESGNCSDLAGDNAVGKRVQTPSGSNVIVCRGDVP
jgi:hypothetical protein